MRFKAVFTEQLEAPVATRVFELEGEDEREFYTALEAFLVRHRAGFQSTASNQGEGEPDLRRFIREEIARANREMAERVLTNVAPGFQPCSGGESS
jgi:hypothetical protein